MTDIRVIPTKNYKGKLDNVDLEKKIEELMSEGFEITHAQNDYIIFMRSFSHKDQIQDWNEQNER